MSADDFRDLVQEFDHDGVTSLAFYRWNPPDFAYGQPVTGTGGYTAIVMPGPYAFVPNPPSEYRESLPEGDRQRDICLIWQVSEILGVATPTLQTIKQSGHSKPDRVHNVTLDRWYAVATQYDYRAVAKVNGVVCVLIDGDPLP